MSREIYIAGPFFNAKENDVIGQIENYCKHAVQSGGIDGYFSPRKSGGNADRQKDVQTHASDIFKANYVAIDASSEIIAVLDRQFMPGQTVALLRNKDEKGDCINPPEVVKADLQQPDLGTVWEMGYAYAKHTTVVGFSLRERGVGKMNLMLTQSCIAVLHGWTELSEYLNSKNPRSYLEDIVRTYGQVWQGKTE